MDGGQCRKKSRSDCNPTAGQKRPPCRYENLPLADWLDKKVFANSKCKTFEASKEDTEGFNKFFENYTKGLAIEKCATESIE